MNKAKWSVLALAVVGALAWAGGRSQVVAAPEDSPMATVLPSANGFGAGSESTSDPLSAMVQGFWNAAIDGDIDTRRSALQQIEFLLRMPQAQSWPIAATLLERGAIDIAESSAQWPRALRNQAEGVSALARAMLTDIEAGPPVGFDSAQSLLGASLQAEQWRQGLRVQLDESMELGVQGLSSCSTRVAYLTRGLDGRMIAAGVLSDVDERKPVIATGNTVLRSFSAACGEDLELSLTLTRPARRAPQAHSLLALNTPYAFQLDDGEVRSYAVPSEDGVVYSARTSALQDGADTRLGLFDASRKSLGEDDDGGGDLASRLHWIGDGQPRTLDVAALDGRGGRFQLELLTEPGLALTADGIDLPQQSLPAGRWYQFHAQSSGRYRVDVDPGDDVDPVVMVFAPGSPEPVYVNDDRDSGDLGAGLELWMAGGESIGLLAAMRADEGEYAIRVTPIQTPEIGDQGQLPLAEVNKLSDLRVVTPGERSSVSFDAAAGSTYVIAGRTADLSVASTGTALTLLGEHAIYAEARDESHEMRISVSCWQAQADGPVQITLRARARGVPIAVGRRNARSGLCPQSAAHFSSAPIDARTTRAEASPVAINTSTEVRLPAGVSESWLRLPRGALSNGAAGIEFALRQPGSMATPQGVKARLVDALTNTEVDRNEGCGLQLFDVKSDRDYLIAINLEQPGTQQTSVMLDLQSWQAHRGLKVGDRVVVHRHYIRQGSSNWSRGMEAFMGKTARVTELVDGSPGEQLVRLDIDDNKHVWRSESLVPVGI